MADPEVRGGETLEWRAMGPRVSEFYKLGRRQQDLDFVDSHDPPQGRGV